MEIWHSEALLATTATLKARKPRGPALTLRCPINDEFTPTFVIFYHQMFSFSPIGRSQFLTKMSASHSHSISKLLPPLNQSPFPSRNSCLHEGWKSFSKVENCHSEHSLWCVTRRKTLSFLISMKINAGGDGKASPCFLF